MKKLESNVIQNTYFTDITNWVCGCSSFLTSRFFICKHLVQQKGTVPIDFFNQVYRYHQYPFLGTSSTQTSNFESISYNTMNLKLLKTLNLLKMLKLLKILKICKFLKKCAFDLSIQQKKHLKFLKINRTKKILDG
ncbi:hypothetical protein C2G38_2312605 [Gigaspora rosea]|uniref:SWIM-type domain-containing protein n=1 Tax=Gigaspora rosea TaxID=44941 RepID=A0A397VCH9_9GLOM|nr:hypothetical protein C2G38_2312605 [Gigaspora rosea]